jgi:hypothetical protein
VPPIDWATARAIRDITRFRTRVIERGSLGRIVDMESHGVNTLNTLTNLGQARSSWVTRFAGGNRSGPEGADSCSPPLPIESSPASRQTPAIQTLREKSLFIETHAAAAAARLDTPSFSFALVRCLRTVRSVIPSTVPM